MEGKNPIFTFCDSNETFIFMSKFSMEACPQMNWLSKERKDSSFHNMSQKDQKLKRKLTFDIPKFKFQNGLECKTSIFRLFWDKQACRRKPLNKCANIIADSETFKRYVDFDTWVGRWLKWNDGIIIFSHYFLTNVVITGYLS